MSISQGYMPISSREYTCGIVLLLIALSSWFQMLGFMAYGRDSKWKLSLPNRISWFLMELPNLLWIAYFAYQNDFKINLPMSLFMFHYVNRTIIYPLRSKSNSPMSLVASSSAFLYTSINGYLQFQGNTRYGFNHQIGVLQIVGTLLFAVGMGINVISDEILRVNRSRATQKSKYVVVNMFLFKYVTMANYFGQIVEWIGYALVAQTFGAILFAFNTLNCLLPSGIARHEWNMQKIPNYPKDKKAVIPFVI